MSPITQQAIVSKHRFRNPSFLSLGALPSSTDGFQGHFAHLHQEVDQWQMECENVVWGRPGSGLHKMFIFLWPHLGERLRNRVQLCVQEEEQTGLVTSHQSLSPWGSQRMSTFFILPIAENSFLIPRFIFSFIYFFLYPFSLMYFLYSRVSRVVTQCHTSRYSFLMRAHHFFNTSVIQQIFKCLPLCQPSCLLLVQGWQKEKNYYFVQIKRLLELDFKFISVYVQLWLL